MGLLNCSMPEEYGGGGGDYRHEMIIMEELVRANVDGFGLSLHNAIVAPYILHYGTEVADTGGEGKMSKSLFVVETDDLEGFRRGRILDKVGMDAQDTAELFFDDMKVPADALLGPETGHGFIQLMKELPQERLNIAVQGVAQMEAALQMTIDYVKERKAFGKPILNFQNTQFELAECKTIVHIAKTFTYDCAEKHLRGELDTVSF